MLKSRHIADSYIYATHTLLICEIEDKEEGESSRNYMYISILHPFLCSSCKYFKQNKCVKLEIIYVYHHHCSRNIAYTSMNLCLLLVAIVVNCVAVKVDILKVNLFEFTSNHIQNCCEG